MMLRKSPQNLWIYPPAAIFLIPLTILATHDMYYYAVAWFDHDLVDILWARLLIFAVPSSKKLNDKLSNCDLTEFMNSNCSLFHEFSYDFEMASGKITSWMLLSAAFNYVMFQSVKVKKSTRKWANVKISTFWCSFPEFLIRMMNLIKWWRDLEQGRVSVR